MQWFKPPPPPTLKYGKHLPGAVWEDQRAPDYASNHFGTVHKFLFSNEFPEKYMSVTYHRGQNYYKNIFTKKMAWRNSFCNSYKRITLQSKFLGLFSCKKDPPVAATLQRKSSGGIIFVIITKIITK